MDESSGTTVQEFLGEFWKSFRKHLLILIGLAAVLFGLAVYLSTATGPQIPRPEKDEDVVSSMLTIVFTYGTLLFVPFCLGWAGAMRRCGVETVFSTITVGASIPATLAAIALVAFSFSADSSLSTAIGAAIGAIPDASTMFLFAFLFSWFWIIWVWFTLGIAGPFWW